MSAARSGQSRALRVFVVESHADTRVSFTLYLQSFGHVVTAAATVAEALAAWPQAPHDVFISDLRLPDGDGWSLLGLLFPRPRYAIAATGLGSAEDRAKSQAAGYRHHLLKPFKLAELAAALEEAARELAPFRPEEPLKARLSIRGRCRRGQRTASGFAQALLGTVVVVELGRQIRIRHGPVEPHPERVAVHDGTHVAFA